jgi:hypothetical protein
MHNLNIFLKFYKNRNKTHVRLPSPAANVLCVCVCVYWRVRASLLISELFFLLYSGRSERSGWRRSD